MSVNVTRFPRGVPQWSFADRARRVRRDLGITQEAMADRLGVGLKAYSAWESGKNTPEDLPQIAVTLEKITGVERGWFLGWLDDDAPPPSTGGADEPGSPTKITNRLLALQSNIPHLAHAA
jgi:transcriptional regulator with XRE-family HTH domain